MDIDLIIIKPEITVINIHWQATIQDKRVHNLFVSF